MHDEIYHFWSHSIGSWQSKLSKLTIDWLNNQELLLIANIHHLPKTDFGIKMEWEYKNKNDSGHVFWGINSGYSDLVFSNKEFRDNTLPGIYKYQLINIYKLVMTVDEYEEIVFIETEKHRLRERRYAGKLIGRLREERVDLKTLIA